MFSDNAINISIQDEGAGEFLVVSDVNDNEIRINPEEWPSVRFSAETLLQEIDVLESIQKKKAKK